MRASTSRRRAAAALAQLTTERDQAMDLADSLATIIRVVLAGADQQIGALRQRLRDAGLDDEPPAIPSPDPDQLARIAAGMAAIADPADVLAASNPGEVAR